jgi:hypothetical protein
VSICDSSIAHQRLRANATATATAATAATTASTGVAGTAEVRQRGRVESASTISFDTIAHVFAPPHMTLPA